MNNIFNGDYKTAFNEAVTDIIAQSITDRSERIQAIQALIDAYTDSVGETPDNTQLERLTDYVLREELTDPDPHKVAHNEYPFFSETQLERRKFGQRGEQETNICGEVSLDEASYVATDGRNYRYPSRRKRTIDELIFVDEAARIRNKDRSRKYRDFVKGREQGVFTVNIASGEKIIRD